MIPFAVFLILEKGGQIHLQRPYNTGYRDGEYDLTAGHMEGNESVQQTIIREAKEEIGIGLHEEDLKVLHVMHNTNDADYFNIFLAASTWVGEPKNMEPEKCDDVRWFAKDSLPSPLTPHVHQALANIRNGIFYSNFGGN